MSLDSTISSYKRFKSTYWQYKHDSDCVANWLATTAVGLGYPKDLVNGADRPHQNGPKAARLKGRARKVARDAAKSAQASNSKDGKPSDGKTPKYLIAVKEFIALAEWIVSRTPPPKVPVSFVDTIERAIAARKNHQLMWHGETDLKEHESENPAQASDGHSHFIRILESVRETLKPLADLRTLPVGGSTIRKRKNDSPVLSRSCINRFEALNIDEPTSEFLQNDQNIKSSVIEEKFEDRYAADTFGVISEAHFAFTLMGGDLDDIRQHLKSIWVAYNKGECTIVSASLATDAAVDLARQLEEDYNQTFGAYVDLEKNMILKYLYACRLAGEHQHAIEKEDDMMNFAVWSRVERWLYPTWTHLTDLQTHAKEKRHAILCHRPENPMGFQSSISDERAYARDRYWEDEKILDLILPDISVFALMGVPLPAEDRMTAGMREIFDTQELSLASVLAAQIFLDIYGICGEHTSNGYKDLVSTAEQVEKNIVEMLEFHKKFPVEVWPKAINAYLLEILTDIKMWVNLDAGVYHRSEYWKPEGRSPPGPSPTPFVFLKTHPWYCGLLSYNLQARAQSGALASVNTSGSILFSAHLYNALRQEKLLSVPWPDMHLALTLHGTEEMFVGNFPSNAHEYYRRLILVLGFSARNFAKDCKPSSQLKKSSVPRRKLEKIAPIHRMFLERHTEGQDRLQFSKRDLEVLLDSLDRKYESRGIQQPLWSSPRGTLTIGREAVSPSKTVQVSSSISPWTAEAPEASHEHIAFDGRVVSVEYTPPPPQTSSGGKLYLTQLLEGIATGIQLEAPDFAFNHFGLHISALQILREVKSAVRGQVEVELGPGFWDREQNLHSLVEYLLRLNAYDVAYKKPGKTAYNGRVGSILPLAAEAMQLSLSRGVGDKELRRLQSQLGRTVTVLDPYAVAGESMKSQKVKSQNMEPQKVGSEDMVQEIEKTEDATSVKGSALVKMND